MHRENSVNIHDNVSYSQMMTPGPFSLGLADSITQESHEAPADPVAGMSISDLHMNHLISSGTEQQDTCGYNL